MWHTFFEYAFFVSFCIAHTLDGNFGECGYGQTWSFILWMGGRWMMLIPSVEISKMNMGMYVVLITQV